MATWTVEEGGPVPLGSCTHAWGQAAAGGGAGGERVAWAPVPGLCDRSGTLEWEGAARSPSDGGQFLVSADGVCGPGWLVEGRPAAAAPAARGGRKPGAVGPRPPPSRGRGGLRTFPNAGRGFLLPPGRNSSAERAA